MSTVVQRKAFDVKREESIKTEDGIRIIGVGLPRTGTTSLKRALEILGFGPCHHMMELFQKPEQTVMFIRAYDGEKIDFQKLLNGYRAAVDLPALHFYQEIHQVYPKAKLILSIRDNPEKWYDSYQNTIGRTVEDKTYFWCVLPLKFLRLQAILAQKASERWIKEYGLIGLSMYDQHNQRMIEENKDKNLLIYNVKEGWKPLCRFLEVDEPKAIPYPNENDTKQFQSYIRFAKILGLISWLIIVFVLGFLCYLIIKIV